MIGKPQAFRIFAALSLHLLVGVIALPGAVVAQDAPKYAREYRQTFKGPPENPQEFFFLGPDAAARVKYEAEGLRIKLPAGHPNGTDTGLMTRFGVQGDFEITLKYEVLQEPEPNDLGAQTRFSLYVTVDNKKQHHASVNRHWTGGPPEFLTWIKVPALTAGKQDVKAQTFPAKAKSGKLRLARRGAELSYFVAEGDDANFKLLQKYAFSADNLRNVRIAAATGGPNAAVDVRVTDFLIHAAAFPRLDKLAAQEAKPLRNDAPTYDEPFKGPPRKPGDFVLMGADAGNCVTFGPDGLRIAMPAGKAHTTTGVATAFGVTGDFDVSVRYEILAEPEPADAGTPNIGTRISLTANVGGAKSNDASIRRKVPPGGTVHILTYTSADKLGTTFPVKEKTGRFRLVRTGDLIAYYLAEGLDKEFKLLTTHPFDAADLKDIQISAQTSGTKAALDVRFTDFQIRAASLPRKSAPPKTPAKEYQEPFKGPPKNAADFVLIGKDANKHVKFEPEGLRVTLPAGTATWQPTGVATAFGLVGDFDVSVRYEVLAEPEPVDSGSPAVGTRISLTANVGGINIHDASIRRKVAPFTAAHVLGYQSADKLTDYFPEFKAKTGRFRLVRTGDTIAYYLAEGTETEFKLLTTHPFDTADVKEIQLSAQASGPNAALDVRFTDLRIRAASLARKADPTKYTQDYFEPFKGPPRKAADFSLIGADAGKNVQFESAGLRVQLPTGSKNHTPTGVATAFGVAGDFEITVRYEILDGTNISLKVNLNKPVVKDAMNRPVVHDASISWYKGGAVVIPRNEPVPAGLGVAPFVIQIFTMRKDAASITDRSSAAYPAREKSGRFRMVRTGENLTYYLSEGLDQEFRLVTTHPVGADEVKDVQIYGQTGNPKATVDIRITDLHIRAASLVRRSAPSKTEKGGGPPIVPKGENGGDPEYPTKDYAQTYEQSFKGKNGKPAGWEFTAPAAEEWVQFEPAGLRLAMPAGHKGERRGAGIQTAFGAKGDFEITLSFEFLQEPAPSDEGKFATRLLMGVALDTPNFDTPTAEVATLNRSLLSKGERIFTTWMRNREYPKGLLGGRSTTGTTGRLRLARSGDELFCLVSVGADQPFALIKKYRFGAENVKRVAITGMTGHEKALLDVRLTDFRIRADALPGLPSAAAPTADAAAEPQQAAAGDQKIALLIVGLALPIFGVFALAAWLILRRRGHAASPASTEAVRASLSLSCPKCAKAFRAKAETAGKKVRCPRCRAAVLVPPASS